MEQDILLRSMVITNAVKQQLNGGIVVVIDVVFQRILVVEVSLLSA